MRLVVHKQNNSTDGRAERSFMNPTDFTWLHRGAVMSRAVLIKHDEELKWRDIGGRSSKHTSPRREERGGLDV